MGVLSGLMLVKMKNQLRSFARNPGKLIVTAVMIGVFAFVVWAGGHTDENSTIRDRAELAAIIKALYIMMFIMIAYGGMQKGATFFSMADVNLLFPAPLSSVKILMYGLTQQLGVSLMVGVFIMYQYATLHVQYAVTIAELLLILLGYSLTILTANIAAMTIYVIAATSANGSRRRSANRAFIAACVLFLLPSLVRIAAAVIRSEPMGASLAAAASIPAMDMFPFAGWLSWGVTRFLSGSADGFIGLLGAGAGVAALIIFLNRSQPDYYEDVLQATETAELQKQGRRDGRIPEAVSGKKIKLRKRDGELGGEGARAFTFKQRLEDNRSRTLLLSPASWMMLAAQAIMALFMRGLEGETAMISVLGMGLYMQMIFSTTDRWVRELTQPYIYLTPEPPFKKLLACLSQVFRQQTVESSVTWILCGIILRMSAPAIILAVATRLMFSLLLAATNLTVDMLWGHLVVKWLQTTLYFLLLLVILAPGVTLGIILMIRGVVILSPVGTLLAAILAVETPIGLGMLYACRNVLDNAEMNQG
ncbi:MAG: putative ABC exporter domain-containing protein [Oscillospiraceae bacterium]|jgi:hypothetical protein|nr:putative ABC exporter domain-containing protein [Oscillospiraceae bacterium]